MKWVKSAAGFGYDMWLAAWAALDAMVVAAQDVFPDDDGPQS